MIHDVLTVPSLLLYGGRDGVIPARWITEAAERADRLEVEKVGGAGHFLPEEKPNAVAKRVISFFDQDGAG